MADLKNIVKSVIAGIEKKEKEELNIIEMWGKAVGKKAARHTRPVSLKTKKLIVNVSDSAWLYKLTLEKKALIKNFNGGLGKRGKICELQFKIGDI